MSKKRHDQERAMMFLNAVCGAMEEESLTDAFRNIVDAYYREYTDATEMDAHSYIALQNVFDWCFPCGEDSDGVDFDEIVKKRA